jgi:hypothetical protein
MEPLPFAVIARRAELDDFLRLSLETVLHSIQVPELPSIAPEFWMAATFELTLEEAQYPRPLHARLIDPDGAELDNWRVPAHVVPVAGSRDMYYLIIRYRYIPITKRGDHEIRIEYDVDRSPVIIRFCVEDSG